MHAARIPDHGRKEMVDTVVMCMYPGCHGGKVDMAENQRIITPFAGCPTTH